MAKRGLGKGLEALFEDNSVFSEQQGEQMIPISEFTPNPDQPRKEFDRQALEQLADSIREHGVIQPLVVTAQEDGSYLIVAGERRYRAARMAGLTELPAVVRDLSAQQIMEFALIENLQREDLNPMEEAAGYQQLIQEYGFTQEQVAHSVGKSRPVIANALRLMNLPAAVAALVRERKLSTGHARALLALEDPEEMSQVAKQVVAKDWTVRQVEKYCRKKETPPKPPKQQDTYLVEAQAALEETTGRKIAIQGKEEEGSISIPYYSKEELHQLVEQISRWLES